MCCLGRSGETGGRVGETAGRLGETGIGGLGLAGAERLAHLFDFGLWDLRVPCSLKFIYLKRYVGGLVHSMDQPVHISTLVGIRTQVAARW